MTTTTFHLGVFSNTEDPGSEPIELTQRGFSDLATAKSVLAATCDAARDGLIGLGITPEEVTVNDPKYAYAVGFKWSDPDTAQQLVMLFVIQSN